MAGAAAFMENPQAALAVAQAMTSLQTAASGAAPAQPGAAPGGATGKSKSSGAINPMMDAWNSLTSKCLMGEVESEDGEEDEGLIQGEVRRLRLRMYIYAAEHLPRYSSYVSIAINSGTESEVRLTTPIAAESEHPVWEFNLDEEVQLSGASSRLDLKVWGTRIVGPKLLGSATLQLPSSAMDSPQAKKVQLTTAGLMQWDNTHIPRLSVVWQLCLPGAYTIDLNRVALLDPSDLEKSVHYINIKLLKLALNQESPPQTIGVTFKLMRLDGSQATVRNSPLTKTRPRDGEASALAKLQESFQGRHISDHELQRRLSEEPNCLEAVWERVDDASRRTLFSGNAKGDSDGCDIESFVLHGSKMTLMSWFLDISVYAYQTPSYERNRMSMSNLKRRLTHQAPEAQPICLGSWREPLSDLEQTISDSGHALHFSADLGERLGCLTMELDVFDQQPHRSLRGQPEKRRGMPPEHKWQDKIHFYCSCMADGLPVTRDCRPYVRVTMGSSVECSEVLVDHSTNDIVWKEPLVMHTTRFHRKATVELFHCLSTTGEKRPAKDELLGTETIYDVYYDKEYWINFFGGAQNATNADIAMNMVRGASTARPASTYQGSVALHFGSKRNSRSDFVSRLQSRREQMRLRVRLHRGLYVDAFRGRKVTILCQVAGCRLPDLQEAKRLLRLRAAQAQAERSQDPADREIADRLAEEKMDPKRQNRNILSFSGAVNDVGVLSFAHPKAAFGAPERCEWIELTTMRDFPLRVPPNATHVYLYVVGVGEEDEAPKMFARLRLGASSMTTPRWRRLRWDRSVVDDIPASHFPHNIGGFILGSAELVPAESPAPAADPMQDLEELARESLFPEAVARPCVCSLSWRSTLTARGIGSIGDPRDVMMNGSSGKVKRTVYCYVDMLAARELPAMDTDGLLDPAYSVRVLDQKLTVEASLHKTTSPSFMHRTVLSFEVELDAPADGESTMVASTVPMPPVIVDIMDFDQSQSRIWNTGDTYETVGTIIVKHCPEVGSTGQWIYKFLEHDPSADYEDSGAMFTSTPPALDLNTMHHPYWYALDTPGRAPFDAAAGGVDMSWHSRPRVLLAVGYSLQKLTDSKTCGEAVKLVKGSSGSAWQIQSEDQACYQIDINLLGLRSLSPQILNPRLLLSSFWPGKSVEFDVTGNRDHTFMHEGAQPKDFPAFAAKMKPLLMLRSSDSDETVGAPHANNVVLLSELCGVRVRAPVYRVPVVPYLQQQVLQPGVWEMTSEDEGKGPVYFTLAYNYTTRMLSGYQGTGPADGAGKAAAVDGVVQGSRLEWRIGDTKWSGRIGRTGKTMEDLVCHSVDESLANSSVHRYRGEWQRGTHHAPFVLLPAVTFELSNALTGQVYLTLTVGLNRLQLAAGGFGVPSWTELSLQEIKTVPEELKRWRYSSKFSFEDGTEGDDGGDADSSPTAQRGSSNGLVKPLSNLKFMEDAYECFVDVFAAQTGLLSWDPDFRLGRPLTDQCLFYIGNETPPRLDTEPTIDEHAQPQYFNPGDWMFRGVEGPFDMRVTPSLSVHPPNLDGIRTALAGGLSITRLPSAGNIALDMMAKSSVHSVQVPKMASLQSRMRRTLKEVEAALHPKPQHDAAGRHAAPLGPSQLFKHVLGHTGCISQEELRTMKTAQLQERLARHNWRAMTHLCAPEGGTRFLGDNGLSDNLHTFMRPVGHIISSKDRDSRLLARLRMGLPLHALEDLKARLSEALDMEVDKDEVAHAKELQKNLSDEEKRWDTAGKSTVNFLIIKFKQNGMVIWAAPKENQFWGRPGSPLFAVRLADNPDVVVPVVVPSFDIRRKAETAWYPAKHLKERCSTLQRRIMKQQEGNTQLARNRRWSRARAARLQDSECPSGNAALEDKVEAPPEPDPYFASSDEPDGYTRPIYVSRNAFVCRLRRRAGGVTYDRCQTKNWYKTALESAFPELAASKLDPDDDEAYKKYVLSRFLNVRKQLTSNEQRANELSAWLKGHIAVQRVKDPQRKSEQDEKLPACTAPEQVDPTHLPITNLWVSENMYVRIVVLSAHKLDLSSLGVAGSFSCCPFLMAKLGAEEREGSPIETGVRDGQVNFYQSFSFTTTFPGTAMLSLELKHRGLMNETTIGTVNIDVEDRLLVLRRRTFREMSNKDFLLKSVSPSQVLNVKRDLELKDEDGGWIDPRTDTIDHKGAGKRLTPHRAFAEPAPIEIAQLVRQDDQTASEGQVGVMRYWIDLFPVGSHMPDDPDTFFSSEFEVRVSIYDVTNISVFRDFGERNDVYVKGLFRTVDYSDTSHTKTAQTDTHKFARKEASFCYNWSFPLKAPTSECTLELTLMDADKFGENDLMYYPKTYSLDQFVMLAYMRYKANKEPLGPLLDDIVFDRWPEVTDDLPQFNGCCVRRVKRKMGLDKKMFAKMRIGFQVLPKDYADTQPFTQGQFQQPKNRFTYRSAVENPQATAKMILGPRRWRQLVLLVGSTIVLVTLLMISACVYYILEVAGKAM